MTIDEIRAILTSEEMTRSEALALLDRLANQRKGLCGNPKDDCFSTADRYAINAAIKALRGPAPDPETGLVPCGCGGRPVLWKSPSTGFYSITCDKCDISKDGCGSEQLAKQIWNRAMRGEAQP